LVVLLDTGSTQLIRNTAAQQLADVQKNHPDELFNLLTRVVPFLRSSSWDTRTAAAKALGGIVEHAPKFDPNEEDVKNENGDVKKEENGSSTPLASEDQLQLATLDVEAILTNGKELLGSAGRQYDFKLAGMDPAQRLAHQKKTLTNRLGLGGEYMEDELVTETDIAVRPNLPPPAMPIADSSMSRANSVSESAVVSPSDQQTPSEAMSKRQLNMLKRRRKEELKRDNKK
ncbi:SNF2 family DNA-dependent ATPase domain-containing protein, partial [Aureobasidium melanogenum]